MLPRPKSHSSDPIFGATAMASSSSSAAFLLTPNNIINPYTAHLSSVAMNMSRRPSLPANHPLLHHHHPMERQRSYDPRRQPPGFYLQQQALLQEQFEQQQQRRLSQPELPPAPVSLQHQEMAIPLQRPALTPLSPSRSMSSLSSTSTLVSSLSSTSISSTLSSSTLTTISTAVRHPLWRLDCKSCKTTLSEQAMLGHLAGDPDKKLFSTNLAVGGSVCGYKLVQACAGCKTDRGNGHFWIFYANQVVSHWRRIKDGNYAVTTAATISTASTSDITTTTEKETTPAAAVSKWSLEDLCPQLGAISMSQFEQSENVTHAMDKQGGGAFGEVDVVLAKCHLASVECEGDDEAEGRPMYWDDLPTWQSQAEGNVGR
ncbi:hypothetical protein BGZ89_004407 [Linnemannia elongata]|nr:hypothetical protein BGZ89_004407 [Linnemannia elongata]